MFWERWFKNSSTAEAFVDYDVSAIILSDNGCVRANNEDAARFIKPSSINPKNSKGYLAIVADGMGGHASGEVASNLAIHHVSNYYYNKDGSGAEHLHQAFKKANKVIFEKSLTDCKYKGMGTTCSAILISGNEVSIVHVGDSRIYIVDKGEIQLVTEDHTYIMELLKANSITETEYKNHPSRNILTRAMGTKPSEEYQMEKLAANIMDIQKVVLCSDGLHEYISQEEIKDSVLLHSKKEAAEKMMNLAKQRGGLDNITIIILEIVVNQ